MVRAQLIRLETHMASMIRMGIVLIVASSSVFAAGSALAAQPQSKPDYTIVKLDQAAPIVETIEDPAPGRHGDVTYFEAPLTRDGKPAGNLRGTLVINDVTPDSSGAEVRLRTLVFALPKGQIVAIGTSDYALPLVANVPVLRRASTTAIVGGTGAYSGARGQVKSIRNTDGTYRQILMILK